LKKASAALVALDLVTIVGCSDGVQRTAAESTTPADTPEPGTSSSANPQPANGQGCANSCETLLWPRVMIAAMDGDGKELTTLTITASDESGRQLMSYLHGCPADLPNRYLCTYGLHGSAGNPEITITFTAAAAAVSKLIDLRPRNYCGREIAYVPVTLSTDGQLIVDDPTYVSPCADFDDP
jgi:hypothetical protein